MIRVIGGQAKRRKLYGPSGQKFRPATGIVKEFIFSYLQLKIMNASVLDLFAGSGSLGIEALSRGASFVHFIDRSEYSVNIIKKNLVLCNFTHKSSIIKDNVFTQLPRLSRKGISFNFILADPPFKDNLREKIVRYIDEYNLLKNYGLLFVKHSKGDSDTRKQGLRMIKQRNFGINVISIYS
ncbi:MAG: 16S rRNA (guanine(966)-N(2))-methyltransferase RsmD [bacterium]